MAVDKEEALKIAKELMIAAMSQKLVAMPSPITVGRDTARALADMLDELVTRIEMIQDKRFIVPAPK